MAVEVTRMVIVRCVDWPVMAAGAALQSPVAAMVNNHVIACSPRARQVGVRVGHRKREAQRRCPTIDLLAFDPQRSSVLFGRVVAALEAITPLVEIYESGMVGFPTRGPSRFYGGEEPLAKLVNERVGDVLAELHEEYRQAVQIGVADGAFAARLAASDTGSGAIRIVEPGGSAEFLAPKSVDVLDNKPLVDLLVRLGLTTLGAWAEIPEADVSGRFGTEGLVLHRLANGLDEYPPDLRRPAPELTVSTRLEPPAESILQCEHVAAVVADRLLVSMRSKGVTCTRLGVEVETENGETLTRWWRYHGSSLSASLIAERVRQQLYGWLREDESVRPRSGILRISLIPDEVVPAEGDQMSMWDVDESDVDGISRLISRLQTVVGTGTIWVPSAASGIGPDEQVELVPADSVDLERGVNRFDPSLELCPGRIPAPAPTRVFTSPGRAELLNRRGAQVRVNGRGELWGDPKVLVLGDDRFVIESWAGPWLDDRYWWEATQHRRRARMQVLTTTMQAFLLVSEHQQWWLEAAYD